MGFGGTSDGPYQGIIENPPSEPALAGDYNEDGIVDAADYVVWRKGLGTIYIQAQYDVWRANFGKLPAGARRYAQLTRCRPGCPSRLPWRHYC